MKKNINDAFKIFRENNIELEVKPTSELRNYIRPDDDPDFHTYRILLLIKRCGKIIEKISPFPLIYGRSKFAFYDFLIRNPFYFQQVLKKTKSKKAKLIGERLNFQEHEKAMLGFSEMIAYIRSPWDMNYDNYFSYMVSKDLVSIKYKPVTASSTNKFFILSLTEVGFSVASKIEKEEEEWCNRMEVIIEIFKKNATANRIENFIQENFSELIIS